MAKNEAINKIHVSGDDEENSAIKLVKEPLAVAITCMAVFLLLGNCSCVALLSYIHVTMHCLTTCHPWQYLQLSARTPCTYTFSALPPSL